MSESPSTIQFDYIKGNFFRTARADGAWAGTNGFSDVVLNFYSERTPIPKQTVYYLRDGHTLADEIPERRISREGMIREVEISVSMNLEVAKSLQQLLERHIKAIETAKAAIAGEKK